MVVCVGTERGNSFRSPRNSLTNHVRSKLILLKQESHKELWSGLSAEGEEAF